MRARIKPRDLVTNKQKKVIAEFLEEEQEKKSEGCARRVFKLFCIVLNDRRGFGKKRLMDTIVSVSKLMDKHATDEVFWEHVDKRLDQMGVPFEHEDYNEMEG